MALAFPRSLPAIGYTDCDLRIRRFTSQSESGGRLTNIVEYADPLWVVDLTTVPVPLDDFRDIEGWWDSLREGLRSVAFRHPDYVAPKLNMAARGPEATAGTIASITNGNVINVTGVSAGLALSTQDFVSITNAGEKALGRVVQASGSGTTRTIELEPALPTTITAGAVVRFDRAELIMRPVARSFEKSRNGILHVATFQLGESAT